MNKYYDVFIELLERVKFQEISNDELEECLITRVDCEYIYDSEDTLLSDIFFTLKHLAAEEEDITNEEINYFLECLQGLRRHSFDEKMKFLQNNS